MPRPIRVATDGTLATVGRPIEAAAARALPFAHLNLRRNPFGELPLDQWADVAEVEVEPLVRRLAQPGFAVQFMGDCGRGKTTHLMALLRHFPQAAYLHIAEGERPPIPHSHPLFVDEIQRVAPRRRRRLFRRTGISLAIGTHEDVADELHAAGFEVETLRPAERLDADRLCRILNRRVDWARRDPGPLPRVTLPSARAALDRFGDDVRTIELYFYDLFQDLLGIRDV